MYNDLTIREIANLFKDKLDDENIISKIFDDLEFDCSVRRYLDPNELDACVDKFYKEKDLDSLIAIISLIQNGKKSAGKDEKEFLAQVKNYIIEHLTENISVEQIASKFYISYYYLCHLFKKHVKKTLNQYRTAKRLEKAIRALLESDQKITDIATSCGFDNVSYFSEIFFKHVGETPSDFRKNHGDLILHSFYELEDILLSLKMQSMRFLGDLKQIGGDEGIPYLQVHNPGPDFGYFLHEAAIIEFEGVLYASWYNCTETELVGYTPIVERRSYDGGRTWTPAQVIAEDKSAKYMYCPPVYGVSDGKLYMIMNQMVDADYMHSLDLYVLNKETDKFEFLWSRPIPFKLNTNVVELPNGKLLLPGRIGELDGFPVTPAVMISDSGKMDGEWRVVNVAKDGLLPDGETLIYPETTVICVDDVLYMFNRNDYRRVPIVYTSNDFGETWSELTAHDIPYVSSKIYAGKLLDGRYYLVANSDREDRSKLVLYVSEKGELKFTKQMILTDCKKRDDGIKQCHYPGVCEKDGKLYIIATASYTGRDLRGRGAILFTVDLDTIK